MEHIYVFLFCFNQLLKFNFPVMVPSASDKMACIIQIIRFLLTEIWVKINEGMEKRKVEMQL